MVAKVRRYLSLYKTHSKRGFMFYKKLVLFLIIIQTIPTVLTCMQSQQHISIEATAQLFLAALTRDADMAENSIAKNPILNFQASASFIACLSTYLKKKPALFYEKTIELGETALHVAIKNGALDVVRILINTPEIDLNAKDALGITPLHQAVRRRDSSLTVMLINHNVIINVQAENGRTPLHEAVLSGNTGNVRLLVEHKAEINTADATGTTPLAIARQKGYSPIVRFLEQHGAI